ncbi:autotransporter domain-containing protein [Aquipseudomonas campi]|uniref:Autotransporter domain-containing protein n=1 Tax=Aquipseudomonas campi TaxID=2731681 RepID=A0A6M8FSA1_9GAMM|nr:autotransporter domain-containing protein [Pseudomonas campi]QKE63678.1 autotransporter domain-containing protein [Pseudomonas campi]
MNKAFRIVWSHVRNAFVVVDEHTSARGKRSGGAQILAGLGLSLLASGAQAVGTCFGASTTISSAETSQCDLPDGSSVTVTSTGSITESGAPAVYAFQSFGTISNAGSIINIGGSDETDGSAILLFAGELAESGTSVSNLATGIIEGSYAGITLDGHVYSLAVDSISNAGTITGQIGIYAEGDVDLGTLTNSGTISGISNNGGGGIALAGGADINVLNNSGIITGSQVGISSIGASIIDELNNSGVISGDLFSLVDEPGSFGNFFAINITGTEARLVGDVYAEHSVLTLKSGAVFTNENAIAVQMFNIEQGATLQMGAGTRTSSITNYIDADGITVFGGFNNAGTLSMAAGTTGRINGNFAQATSGVLQIDVADDSSYGKLVVNGTATFGSGTQIAVNVANPNYSFSATTLQDVLSATTLSSDGAFRVSDNSILFDFGAIKDGNTVDLTLAAATQPHEPSSGLVEDIVTSLGNNPAIGAAQVLDQVIANDPNGELASHFVGLSSEQEVSDAVTQTLPTVAGNTSNAIGNTLSGINRVIQARQGDNSGLSSGDAPLSEKNLWIKTFGSWADQDERDGISGFDADTQGLAIGTDAAVSETTRLGLAFAYAQTNLDNDSNIAPQSADIDTFQLIGYGSYALSADTELNFQLDGGQNRTEGKRHMPFADATAKADYDGYNFHAGVGIGHNLRLNEQLTFVPSARADYTWIGTESYHEKGAGALNLDVDSNDAEELLLSVDGKLDYALSEATVLSANLGAGYDVIDEDSSITSTYAGASSAAFKTPGMDMEPWVARAGLGLNHTLAGGTEVSLRYDAEARSDFTNQGASLKARWAF